MYNYTRTFRSYIHDHIAITKNYKYIYILSDKCIVLYVSQVYKSDAVSGD